MPREAEPTARRALHERADWLVVAALVAFHLVSFGPGSPVHGPNEIYAQDSVYILEALAEDEPYPWNSQNHLLYHFVLELGYDVWKSVAGTGYPSAFAWLKLFTAACGLVFYALFRRVLVELGLGAAPRAVLLVLAGVSVSLWFHFSAFETHATALPALAAYLLALVRVRDRGQRTFADRALLVGSLLVLGWSRVDLFRFAAATAPLPFLPGARRHRRKLVIELVAVAVLGVSGNTLLAALYYGDSPWESKATVLDRHDRPDLRRRLGRAENLAPGHLLAVGRAVTVYSILAPIEPRDPERSFLAPPRYVLDLGGIEDGVNPETGLYREPATNLLGTALSALAFASVLAALGVAGATIVRRGMGGDPLHAMIAVQAVTGWLFYSFFNPHEPFLWVAEYLPPWVAAVGDAGSGWRRGPWIAVAIVAAAVAIHNVFAFYVPFR
jgi:hypothetical protein